MPMDDVNTPPFGGTRSGAGMALTVAENLAISAAVIFLERRQATKEVVDALSKDGHRDAISVLNPIGILETIALKMWPRGPRKGVKTISSLIVSTC